jgi:transketolase
MTTPIRYEDLLAQLAERDPALVVMTAENRAAIRGLPPRLGPRFIDVGIAEQTLVGMAAGLALRGRRPVAHALATFLVFRAYEFVRDDLAIPGLPVKLIGGVPGFLSDANGPTHQAIEDIALMRGLPNMQVFTPASEAELVAGMKVLMDVERPCYVRYYAGPSPLAEPAPFRVGKAEVISRGADVALLTYGFLLKEALAAKARLEADGLSVGLVNLRMLKPVDTEAILEATQGARVTLTIEDHFKVGGLYSIVAETLLAARATAKVVPVALDDRWFKPTLLGEVLRHEGFTGEQLAARARAALDHA